jgi:inorganic pyrophosphatase
MKKAPALDRIDAIDQETGCVNVIIETPKGSHNKYKYDGKLAAFTLGGILPAGAVFPFDFGFVPSTLSEDGDPLDVLILLDESVPTGCLVKARLIGAIEAEQTEPKGKRIRNDRLLAIAFHAHTHQHVRKLGDLRRKLLDEVEAFFFDYDAQRGKRFKPLRRSGPHRTMKLLKAGMTAFAGA